MSTRIYNVNDPDIDDIHEPPEGGDPVHPGAAGWYFWDETWADEYGPFESEEEARRELSRYCKENGI